MNSTVIKVGLTGNIGSGKSIVARTFRILGAPVYHADIEAKKFLDDNYATLSQKNPAEVRKEIQQLKAYSVVDAMKYVPGAWTESRGRKVKQFFSVRGHIPGCSAVSGSVASKKFLQVRQRDNSFFEGNYGSYRDTL